MKSIHCPECGTEFELTELMRTQLENEVRASIKAECERRAFAAIAAATLTAPLEVAAAGVPVLPLPPPPGAFVSARARWFAVCCVTSDGPDAAPPAP